MTLKSIFRNSGWLVAVVLLTFQLSNINSFCLKQSVEVHYLNNRLNFRGFVKMEDFREFERAYKTILRDYPEMSRNGWEMVMPTDLEDKIEVYYPKRLSATVTFIFKPDGSYEMEAIK